MQPRKSRWSTVYESAEEELLLLFERKHIRAERLSVEYDEPIAAKPYEYDSQLWCAEGQFVCLVQGKSFTLQPGDTLFIPAGASCAIRPGLSGCAYYVSTAVKGVI